MSRPGGPGARARRRHGALCSGLVLLSSLGMWLACGAAAGEGGGFTDLPTRGAGPFAKLEANPDTAVEEPVLLEDPEGIEDWRSPTLLIEGDDRFSVYFVAARGAAAEIRRAAEVSLSDGPGEVSTVLTAVETWEGSRVDHPALVVPGVGHALGLFYEAGAGAIGYAGSEDGLVFERRTEPVLEGDGQEEGDHLGEPAAAWHQGDLWLYYAAPGVGAIFVARFPGGDLTAPERLDADDRTAAREPVLGPNPFAEQFDVGGVGAPWVRITHLAGRPVFDLWYGGWGPDGAPTIGFAGSFDGLVFKRLDGNPVLPPGGADETDPAVVTKGIGTLMLFTQRSGSGPSSIAGALH